MPDAPDTSVPRRIQPARADLDAVVRVPGSKSVTNRALLLAALADGSSALDGALSADDTQAFAAGLRSLGLEVEGDGAVWRMRGGGGHVPAKRAQVYCADAATAARFLLAACAAGRGTYGFDASPQLQRRPLGTLLTALRAQGARTEPWDAAGLPVTLLADGLEGGRLLLPGDTSSQFISALLMAAPLGRRPLDLRVSELVSKPYVDMTVTMMEQFGVTTKREGHERFVVGPASYRGCDYAVEPDASTASYFFAAAAVTGGRVKVLGLRRTGSLQGDVRFLDVLEAMGCIVTEEADGVSVTGAAAPAGITVDMADISDTFMTLAAVAPFATSPVTMTGIANVRLKESDRIAAMQANLRVVGVPTEAGPDFLRVFPCTPCGGRIDPHGDHRIAMAFAVLGLRTPEVLIDDPGCVRKTCPGFFELWRELEQGTG